MIPTHRPPRQLGLLVLLALLLAACGAAAPAATGGATAPAAAGGASAAPTTAAGAPGASGGAIKVGAVIPLTGRYAAGGAQVKTGYELAVEDINKAGGVDVGGSKMPIELTVLDDESDATKTVQRLETLNSNNQVVTYLGGFGSDLHAAAAGIAEKNKIPYLGVAFALKKIHENGFKYLFSPFPKSPDLAVATFDMLDSLTPKPTKVAILAEKTDWGAEMSGLWKAEADKRGYSVVANEQYAVGAKDFTPAVLAAKDGGTEVVLALPTPPDGLALAKQIKELGLNAGVYVFVRAADSPTWAENLKNDGNDFMFMPGWNASVKFPGAAEMVQRYQAKYGKPAQATTGSAYAAVQILADAIKRAGSLDHDKIRDAIAATDMMTVAGPVKFNADGTAQITTIINQWQDGKQVLVWPLDQAAGKVAYPAKPWSER